jgi:hypothetical protein
VRSIGFICLLIIAFFLAAVSQYVLATTTNTTATSSSSSSAQEEGPVDRLQVRILTGNESLNWFANIMDSNSVSGTIEGQGNKTLSMRCDDDDEGGDATYDVDVSKDTDIQESLAVQIVATNNGTVIKEGRTDAAWGYVAIVGDC